MKKILTVAALAGFAALAACGETTTGNAAVDNAVDSQEANAMMYENMADVASNDTVEAAAENGAEAAEHAADAMHDNATAGNAM